jgi:IMP dehydrogenase
MDGDIFETGMALTFDDVLIEPGYSEILPSNVSTRVVLHQDIALNIPLLSAAMDTVTEADLAIALAREGGIGILHRNMSPEAQAREVDKVKRSEAGMIKDPITLTPDASLQEAEDMMARYHISGVPIVDKNSLKLVGILTNRDVRFVEKSDFTRPVSDFMTSEGLVTAPESTSLLEAKAILQKHRIEKLPLVDKNGEIGRAHV